MLNQPTTKHGRTTSPGFPSPLSSPHVSFSTHSPRLEPPLSHLHAYSNRSCAEETIANAKYHESRSAHLPPGFQQEFHTFGNEQYPFHPSGDSRYLHFPDGFCGCLSCSDADHSFKTCPQQRTPQAVEVFHFNLHCHKPSIFFRNCSHTSTFPPASAPPPPPPPHTPSSSIGHGCNATTPSWLSQLRSTSFPPRLDLQGASF